MIRLHNAIDPAQVCAVILAGGRGTRMGGVDKGLQPFYGSPLARHAIDRLRSQNAGSPAYIAINANRNQDVYSAWGIPVWTDALDDYAGPLAGFLTALEKCRELSLPIAYVLTVPCDSPLFPLNLLERMAKGLVDGNAQVAIAAAPETDQHGCALLQKQPVFCLMHIGVLENLRQFTASGGRKIDAWTTQLGAVEVAFDQPGDAPLAFANANTLEQLRALERP